MERDTLCPICMQTINHAFLTACGHSFCYVCIVTHLRNKSDCPCCAHYLTSNNIFPNILLDKLLKKSTAGQLSTSACPVENLRQALQQGCKVSIKELDGLLLLLSEKKKTMHQEESEKNMKVLLDFLLFLRKQKLMELSEIQADLHFILEDISAVESKRLELYRGKERCSSKVGMLAEKSWPPLLDKHSRSNMSGLYDLQDWTSSGNIQNKQANAKAQMSIHGLERRNTYNKSDSEHFGVTKKGKILGQVEGLSRGHIFQLPCKVCPHYDVCVQFDDLQECYLQKRRSLSMQLYKPDEKNADSIVREGYHPALEDFQSVLNNFTRYSRLRVVAELRHGDLFQSANIVSSIEFDRDDEFFATAGVSRRIKVFEFNSVVNEPGDVHCPVVELSTRSKLSCLSWNKYTKNHIASSDYEGIVTVWDVTTGQSIVEYEEHEKRAWSVDFSRTEPSMLVSGSDDCKVKIWCTKQEGSVLNVNMKANICSVKHNPASSVHIAVGSADHNIYYYDLRNISQPLYVFNGHRKAVSYVKFLSNTELASASTDSTLRLWDVKENLPLRTYKGHVNEKNFVGLTVNSEYIACGSETNEVFVYHKAIAKPAAWHKFGSDADDDSTSYFISAVCWKSDSPTVLTANSRGAIKVLVLAADE